MDDLPPPPYTPHDPASAVTTAARDPPPLQPVQATLRGGYLRPSRPSAISEGANVTSATSYFEDRQPSISNGGLQLSLIEHIIRLAPNSTRDDFPLPFPTETQLARDITGLDWSTFVNHLFPTSDETAIEKRNNEKRTGFRRQEEEGSPQRRQRIQGVVAEWNANYFSPRLVHITVEFALIPSRLIPNHTTNHTATNGIPPNQQGRAPFHRSHSLSSLSSSTSSSSLSSVSSIKYQDLDGADINQLRSTLNAFRVDATKSTHLRQSVRQLRNDFRSHRRDIPHHERKEFKKEYKEQRRELKREVKAVVKEAKASRKADRKLRRAERKSRRQGKRAETRGADRVSRAQEKAQRKVDKAQRKALKVQERAAEHAIRA